MKSLLQTTGRSATVATLVVAVIAACMQAAPSTLGAQLVRGSVVADSADTAMRPVRGAKVELVEAGSGRIVDSAFSRWQGKFELWSSSPGRFYIRGSSSETGSTRSEEFKLERMGLLDVRFEIGTNLATSRLAVHENRRFTTSELLSPIGFEYRRRTRSGFFIDSSMVARLQPAPVTTIIRGGIPGATIMRNAYGTQVVALRVRGSYCAPHVLIDGRQILAEPVLALNSLLPEQVVGIEAYVGRGSTPVLFPGLGTDTSRDACGTIAVWTEWSDAN